MAAEIERKFLVRGWQPRDQGTYFKQGYLSSVKERVVRVRIAGDKAKLTIKGVTRGVSRAEYEYAVPLEDAREMLELCEQPLIEKRRHLEEFAGKTFEIDVFLGANLGLIVAELELASEDEAFERPAWLGDEVSGDERYYNNNLIAKPFTTW